MTLELVSSFIRKGMEYAVYRLEDTNDSSRWKILPMTHFRAAEKQEKEKQKEEAAKSPPICDSPLRGEE